MEKLNLAIDGMSCGHCVARVRHALATSPGVHVDAVSIGGASVAYDTAVTSASTITDAVRAAGYPARVRHEEAR